MQVKIHGFGWVGKAMKTLFPDALVHDPEQGSVSLERCDIDIVCVPTPLKDGVLDISIVEDVVKQSSADLILIRSTVNPGTCDFLERFYEKQVVFQPEYLGETASHPLIDQKARQFIILGGKAENRRKVIELYQTVYNANVTIRQVTNYEAEIIKLSENRAIAFKVMQCQELYDACGKAGIDYYIIRDAVYGDDPRFNLWHTFVYPNSRGFNSSKCLVKDVPAWCAWAESLGANANITKLLVTMSNKYALRNHTFKD